MTIIELATFNRAVQHVLTSQGGADKVNIVSARNLPLDVIKEFGLGFCPRPQLFMPKLHEQGYTFNDINDASMVSKNENGSPYSLFQNRVTIPIHDKHGNIIGFGGRATQLGQQAKYVNSYESELFKKGETLFNLHRALPEIGRKLTVYLVEGFFDVMAFYAAGITNVIATCGTALTYYQATILKLVSSRVYLCYDGDEAGKIAEKRSGEILNKLYLPYTPISLGEYKDASEVVTNKGVDVLTKMVIEQRI